MKIFALTKSEQRVAVLVMIALLAGTIAMRYHTLRANVSPTATTTPATTVAPNREDDAATPDESP